MVYELRYYEMDFCSNNNPVEDGDKTREIEAGDDKAAVREGNAFLEEMSKSVVIPWAPMLYCGERKVATSDPSYPPLAHRLAWLCVT